MQGQGYEYENADEESVATDGDYAKCGLWRRLCADNTNA